VADGVTLIATAQPLSIRTLAVKDLYRKIVHSPECAPCELIVVVQHVATLHSAEAFKLQAPAADDKQTDLRIGDAIGADPWTYTAGRI
jgi:hypothetical protein